jgi:hypothetical protein
LDLDVAELGLSEADVKTLTAAKLKELAMCEDHKRALSRAEAFQLQLPREGFVRAQGDCLCDSAALDEHRGIAADWLEQRHSLSLSMRKRICDFLESNEATTIPGVSRMPSICVHC